jgi:GT2 family glycosyltransferase
MKIPVVTVCIPSHGGRGSYTAQLLKTLTRASEEVVGDVEIIVVDDSLDAESIALSDVCHTHKAVYLRGPRSAGAKRNIAARHARSELLFFIDSDCLAVDSTLTTHLEFMREVGPAVAGVVGLIRMCDPEDGVWHTIRGSQFHNPCFDYAERYDTVGWGTTANLLVRRDIFLKAHGFDETSFTAVGGEDVDLGLRITDAGYTWLTNADALVLHRRGNVTRLKQIIDRLFTYGRADVFLSHRHPRYRRQHLNPYAGAAVIGLGIFGIGRPRLALAAVPTTVAAVLLAETRRRSRSGRTIYGGQNSQAKGNFREQLTWVIVDSAFDAGIVAEAVRRRQLALAFNRFNYVPINYFPLRS